MDIYLLNFNNYYNRQIKLFELLSNYTEFLCKGSTYGNNPINGVNFNPGNGINSAQVINWDGDNPDYIIAADGNEIISRWYVIQSERLRNGQFRLVLYRDLVADYYEEVMRAPMFIEKGYVSTSDPAIYNSENMSFNQIKKSEYLLKDGTGCAWIVGYCTPKQDNAAEVSFGGRPTPNKVLESEEDWEWYPYIGTTKLLNKDEISFGFYSYAKESLLYDGITRFYTEFNRNRNNKVDQKYFNYTEDVDINLYLSDWDFKNKLNSIRATEEMAQAAYVQYAPRYDFSLANLLRLNNNVLKIGENYFRVNVSDNTETVSKTITAGSNIFTYFKNLLGSQTVDGESMFEDTADLVNTDTFVVYPEHNVEISLVPIDNISGFDMTFPATRPVLQDAPYTMFCIPYGEYTFKTSEGTYTTSKETAVSLAGGIATALGGTGQSNLYDLQLLPYCPISLLRDAGNSVDLTDPDYEDNLETLIHTASSSIIFYATESTGSFNITYNYYTDMDAIRFKVKEQTTMMRLCSPNYNGLFEFNPFRNGGIQYINVDYTYKPHQPYIHLNPNFGALYGKDFNDARGLICSGDFSLPIIDNAWVDYQISNKNYNEIFKRNLSNMETQYDVAREQEKWAVGTGTFTGAVAGASAGFMSGAGGWGAAIGGVLGGTLSLAGGLRDIELNEKLRTEAIDFAKDQFGYQLGNIKALPEALSKVSAYNANNKIFPFLEVYSATKEEEEALRNKLIYNGMSIFRIGKLEDYILNKPDTIDYGYFKGKIIRLEDLGDDFLVANTLANELNKGVYII